MDRASRSGVLSETASCADTPRSGYSQSIMKIQEGALDISSRFSYCKPNANRDKMLQRRYSLNLPEHMPGHYSRAATERNQKATSKV
ncbi:hypothetical protein GUJ93_ZPchr0009g2478 [Zizania palustris]|uniref:Uncharacterized protein n=1 Tax=Zizania palustris TaxID=103762 RepID=A0A8J5RIG3_ZIZPA|nr:hypothetical protein GUJ93_ZPchr0009g2478 [Zizania palustris]